MSYRMEKINNKRINNRNLFISVYITTCPVVRGPCQQIICFPIQKIE